MKKSPVVHFEMPYKDAKRVAEFYRKALGWDMKEMGPEMGGYVLAMTTEIDNDNMVKTPGNINGGFFEWKEDNKIPSVVIQVENLKEAMENIKSSGGTIMREPEEIPGVGMWAVFNDTEGNRVSLIEEKKK